MLEFGVTGFSGVVVMGQWLGLVFSVVIPTLTNLVQLEVSFLTLQQTCLQELGF